MTEVITELDESSLKRIVKVIDNGGVIAFPTETVYALAVDASNYLAVEKIYKLKNRFSDKPLPVLVGDIYQANRIVEFNSMAQRLALNLFPGPITLVLKSNPKGNLAKNINHQIGSVGIRMPNSIAALKILKAIGRPIVGTSANITSQKSALSAEEVLKVFKGQIDIVVDQGAIAEGVPSTIVDLTESQAKILREGVISKEKIGSIIGQELV